ncbi:MAG TPA: phage baseplate assembly protein V [Candidatus Acidoferrum sp.]|nr:phage baseplate assembly protein V [Candidatus Acidoferrum sp.]
MQSTFDNSPVDLLLQSGAYAAPGGRWFGIYPALVSDIKDPDGNGRVKVTLPWSPDTGSDRYEMWARLATLMGGNNRGSWFVPDVNDEVLVAFEGGDPRRPYVLGGLWNGSDSPPESMDGSGQNNKKVLRSRNGVKITLDDQNGQEKFIAETPGGQKITLQDGPGSIEIADSNGNFIKLETSGVTVNAAIKVTVTATQAEINASVVTVNAPMATFSGTVQAQTVICTTIISASYLPGAGNIW